MLSVLICLIATISCQKDAASDATTQLTVKVPSSVQTKAISAGENVNILHYEIWNEAKTVMHSAHFCEMPESGETTILLQLVKGAKYNIVFWAQDDDVTVYTWDNLKLINIDYSSFGTGNKDCYDAFYSVVPITGGEMTNPVLLKRPFAQLNFFTTSMTTTLGDFTMKSNSITIDHVASVFNALEGKPELIGEGESIIFEAGEGLVEEKKENEDYWLSMNYLLPIAAYSDVTVIGSFTTSQGSVSHTISSVPLGMNYKTNIRGELLAGSTQLTVKIEPNFVDEEYEKEW